MATVVATARARMRADRWFFSGISIAVAAMVLVGFSRSWFVRPIFGQPRGFGPLTTLLVLHGIAMTGWITLSVVQPLLVAADNRALHRRLGWVAAGLATVIVLSIPIVTIHSMRTGGVSAFPTIYLFSAVNAVGDLTFAGLIGAAVWWRRRPDTHKRLMVLALAPLVPPAIGRTPYLAGLMPISGFLIMNMVLVAGCLYDLATRRRVHPAWIWGGAGMLLGEVLMVVVGFSRWWHAFGDWAMRLPV
jgi:hypothetical protein